MREKVFVRRRHRRGNKQKKIIIFSMIGFVCMFSVGYAAFSSEFLISGKGTIVEKTITSENLKQLVVINGDGLYKDPVEANRYVYRGADPDNYIWLDLNGNSSKTDSETYRIVAVEADNTIKVVAQNSIGNIPFDPGYETVIDGVTIASSVEGTRYSSVSTDYCYHNSGTQSLYYGCNVWGSKTTMLDVTENNVNSMPREEGSGVTYVLPKTEAYLNTYLNTIFLNGINSKVQSKIATHTYNVGLLKSESGQTLEIDIAQESAYKWRGKIALMNATDYVKASTNSACSNVYEYNKTSDCYNNSVLHNYLFHSEHQWTLSAYSYSKSDRVWIKYSNGYIGYNGAFGWSVGVWPSFFLTSDIVLSGEGTETSPYIIAS